VERPGVQEEVDAWAAGLKSGTLDQRLSPEEALMDLKIVSSHHLGLWDVLTRLIIVGSNAKKWRE
jgi:hypothetical protein